MDLFTAEQTIEMTDRLTKRIQVLEEENSALKEELSILEQSLDIVVKNSQTTFARSGMDLRIQRMYNPNPDFKETQFINKRSVEIMDANYLREIEEFKTRVRDTGKAEEGEIEAKLSSGNLTYKMAVEPIHLDGQMVGIAVACTDITDRKLVEKYLIEAERLASVGQISASVFHEVKNIMAVIMASAQLALSKLKNEPVEAQYINPLMDRIVEQGKKGTAVLTNLLALARGKNMGKNWVNVCKVLEDVVELQKHQMYLEGIQIEKNLKPVSPIFANQELLEQVFLNLSINARHAMKDRGKGKISISIEEVDEQVEIRFSDNGAGMSKEVKSKIFTPFFTTKNLVGSKSTVKGSGLGLAIVAQTIKNHNGTIEVESEEGRGATFIIRFPVNEDY